jgi:hypothetical protein
VMGEPVLCWLQGEQGVWQLWQQEAGRKLQRQSLYPAAL